MDMKNIFVYNGLVHAHFYGELFWGLVLAYHFW